MSLRNDLLDFMERIAEIDGDIGRVERDACKFYEHRTSFVYEREHGAVPQEERDEATMAMEAFLRGMRTKEAAHHG